MAVPHNPEFIRLHRGERSKRDSSSTARAVSAGQAWWQPRLLVERGVPEVEAITRIRRRRPGAIETCAPEEYLLAFGPT